MLLARSTVFRENNKSMLRPVTKPEAAMKLSRIIPCLLFAGLVCLVGLRLQQEPRHANVQGMPVASLGQIFGAH